MFQLLQHSRCKHSVKSDLYSNKVYGDVLELIGTTPLVRLNRLPADHGLKCKVYAKCEYLSPGGSAKDRISYAMMVDAEKQGLTSKNTNLMEYTSGNTGIATALCAAIRGYKSTIVMTKKNEGNKVDAMKLLGAQVVLTADVPESDPQSALNAFRKIREQDPNAVMMEQFENSENPLSHYLGTGPEILEQLGHVDMFVCGAGSGGTVTGIGHKIKSVCPKCVVVIGNPHGSVMIDPNAPEHPFLVEGVGGHRAPIVMDKQIIDRTEVITDKETFRMAREIIVKEGLLVGGSSGMAMVAAIRAAKALNFGEDKSVVVIFTDGIQNYMNKFVLDQWMEAYRFQSVPERKTKWWKHDAAKLVETIQNKKLTVGEDESCQDVLEKMGTTNSYAIVINAKGYLVGVVSKNRFRDSATNPTWGVQDFNPKSPVKQHLENRCYRLAKNAKEGPPTVGLVSRVLDIAPFVVYGTEKPTDQEGQYDLLPECLITAEEVLDYILKNSEK